MEHEVLLKTSSGPYRLLVGSDLCNSFKVPLGVNREQVLLFISTWVSLLSDSPSHPEMKPRRLYRDFLHRISVDGIVATISRCSNLAHQLVSQQTIMGPPSLTGEWIDGFIDTPVFHEYHRYFKTGDPVLLGFLYTWLCFGKKLDYEDKALEEAAFRGWSGTEDRLDSLVLDDADVLPLKRIMCHLLPPFKWSDFRPKFGPGRVAERGVHGRISKISNLKFDPVIDRFLFHGHIGMYGQGADLGISPAKVLPDPSMWNRERGLSSRAGRTMFAKKNYKTYRSVIMEPNTLMLFQQAVLAQVLQLIGRTGFGRFFNVHDQSRNRDLALYGSYTSEIDTLDLSSASDSLSVDLVKRIFPSSWLIPMLATRSTEALLPDGSVRRLKKFAPMGSALCFPTQSLVFAGVCILAACVDTYDNSIDVDRPFLDWLTDERIDKVVASFSQDPLPYNHVGYQPMAVYGDDICVSRVLTPNVKSILARLGFIVNNEKSFTGSQAFRESCGGYYLNGHDITPLYYRISGLRRQLTPEHIVTHVNLANECFLRWYVHTYLFLKQTLATWERGAAFKNRDATTTSVPHVSNPNQWGLLSTNTENKHLQWRENTDLQRSEYRGLTITYDSIQHVEDAMYSVQVYKNSADGHSYSRRVLKSSKGVQSLDAYEYMRWWAGSKVPKATPTKKPGATRWDTSGARIVWRWIPAIV